MTHTGGRPLEGESWWMVGPAGGRSGATRNVQDEHQPLLPTTGAANASVSERRRYPNACGAHHPRYACGSNETPKFPQIQHVGLNVDLPGAGDAPYIATRCLHHLRYRGRALEGAPQQNEHEGASLLGDLLLYRTVTGTGTPNRPSKRDYVLVRKRGSDGSRCSGACSNRASDGRR